MKTIVACLLAVLLCSDAALAQFTLPWSTPSAPSPSPTGSSAAPADAGASPVAPRHAKHRPRRRARAAPVEPALAVDRELRLGGRNGDLQVTLGDDKSL